MAWFSKLEMKAHTQSSSFFPALYVLQGLKRTIWCESLNMLYLSLAERSLLGCPDASIVWRRQWLPSRGLSLPVSCCREKRFSSRHPDMQPLKVLEEGITMSLPHSFVPGLAPPEDLKYFHSKAIQCFCSADLSG